MLRGSEVDSFLPEALPPPSLPTLGALDCSACLMGAGCGTPILLVRRGGEQDAAESAGSQPSPGTSTDHSKIHRAEIQSAICYYLHTFR